MDWTVHDRNVFAWEEISGNSLRFVAWISQYNFLNLLDLQFYKGVEALGLFMMVDVIIIQLLKISRKF